MRLYLSKVKTRPPEDPAVALVVAWIGAESKRERTWSWPGGLGPDANAQEERELNKVM